MNNEIIDSYLTIISELETKVDNLDKEIQFFNNLPSNSIYKCQEIVKLKSYLETNFQTFNIQAYKAQKGYEWFVANHEEYLEELDLHYSIIDSCCCFLVDVLDKISTLLSESIQTFLLIPDTPIRIAYLPIRLLFGCLSIAIQIERVPSEFIVGLKWMSDIIIGKEAQNKDKMRFCSSRCLSLFISELPDLSYFIMQFFTIHVSSYFQIEEQLCYDREDSILWHPCESEPHCIEDVTDEKWITTLDRNVNMNMILMLLIISPQVLIQYDLKDDEHIISKVLTITESIPISTNCSFSIMNEITNSVKRIEKTKDSKSQLALLQKRLKNHNQFKEYHQNRREMLIEKLNFWIDNIKRDQGVTKPYLFVILALYSLAEKEMEYALCNSITKQRVLMLLKSEVMQFATNQDDSIPRLLINMITLRRLLMQNKEGLNEYIQQLFVKMGSKWGLEDCDENEWIRCVTRGNGYVLYPVYHLYTVLQHMTSNPDGWLYEMTEIRTISFYYQRILDFCKKNYTSNTQYADIIFLFIDIQNIIEYSKQHYSEVIHSLIRTETEEIISQMRQEVINVIKDLWNTYSEALPYQELNLTQFMKYVVLIQHYPVISYSSDSYNLVNIIENCIVNYFNESLLSVIQSHPSIQSLLNTIKSFFKAILHIESSIPSLSVRSIIETCRESSTTPVCDYILVLLNQARSDLINKGEFNVINQEFVVNSEIVSIYTHNVLKEIIALVGLQPVYKYTTTISKEMQGTLQQIIQGFDNNIQVLQDKEENLTKVHMNAINTIVEQLTRLGRDDFIFTKMVMGLSHYFKETNWTVDAAISTIKPTQLMNEITAGFGISSTEPLSILHCHSITNQWVDELRETTSCTIHFQDVSYLLFLFFNMRSSYNNLRELFHGCTLFCYLLAPHQPCTFMLQELFKCYINKQMNAELVKIITCLKRNDIDCPIFIPLYSFNEVTNDPYVDSDSESDSD